MTKRIGPSMSTEPGWMAVRVPALLLGRRMQAGRNYPSMLLSFERPAPAGSREEASRRRDRQCAEPTGVIRLSTVLENCTDATSAAIDKRRLKNGYHRALPASCAQISARSSGPAGRVGPDHRQDSKGTRWMPWHQESMKGVNGCDKPRLGAE
jgi:hypothetical protein